MGRTNKIGLDYFPINIDMDEEDERVFMMEAAFGGERAFGILIKLLMLIYRNGYFYPWTEVEQVFFSKKKGLDKDFCIHLVDFLIQKGFFCKHLFDRFMILTSRGIQKRYLEATRRRDKVVIFKDLLLLNSHEINAYKNVIYADINFDAHINGINVDINTTSTGAKGIDVGIKPINVDILPTLVHIRDEMRRDEMRRDEMRRDEMRGEETEERKPKAAPPPASPPEVNSPPKKETPKTKPKDKQLVELAEMLRAEDPEEYQKLLKKHPELIPDKIPWEIP